VELAASVLFLWGMRYLRVELVAAEVLVLQFEV
jgi:hypothetical protein